MKTDSIRTLFITKEVPYPPVGGVSLRTWQNINIMMNFGAVGVFSAANWTPKHTSLPGVALWKHTNVTLERSKWEKLNSRLWWLYPRRHPDANWGFSQVGAQELDEVMKTFQPDLVILEEVWIYPYLKYVKPHQCQIIFDNHNVELFLSQQTSHSAQGLKSKLKAKIQLNHLQAMESDFCRQVNQIWVCSDNDVSLIQKFYGEVAPTYAIPNGINVADYESVRAGECNPVAELQTSKQNILFLGQMSYAPNRVATELLINQIYPRIREIYPDSRLLLVGRNPTPLMLQAAKEQPEIIVTGSVPDVKPYLAAADVMIVPLLQGGGTRLKIVEAFAAGCPVVSTTKGAEGMKVTDGEHLLIRNGVEELVAGIGQILASPSLGEKLAASAYELVKQEYSWEAVGRKVEATINTLS